MKILFFLSRLGGRGYRNLNQILQKYKSGKARLVERKTRDASLSDNQKLPPSKGGSLAYVSLKIFFNFY